MYSMKVVPSLINLEELSREEAVYAEEEAAWWSRQQLRAAYFAEEEHQLAAIVAPSVHPAMEEGNSAPVLSQKAPAPREMFEIEGLVPRWGPVEI